MSLKISTEKSVTRHRNNDDHPKLIDYANKNRNKGFFNDVQLVVNNDHISANRLVLSCYSQYFENIFQASNEIEKTIIIEDLDKNAVRAIVDYFYKGVIEVNNVNALDLLFAAHKFELQDITKFCSEFLQLVITCDSSLHILDAAKHCQCFHLQLKVLQLINECFEKVSLTQPFKALSKADLTYCINHISRDQVMENLVYEAIVRWTMHDEKNRQKDFVDLFKLIKLEKLPYNFVMGVVSKQNLVKDSVTCMIHLWDNTPKTINQKQVDKKKENRILSLGGSQTSSSVLEVYCVDEETAKQYPELPSSLQCHTSAKLNNVIFWMAGKTADDKVSNQVWQLDLNQKSLQWEETTSLIENRKCMSAAVYYDALVVSGGSDDDDLISKTVEIYQQSPNKWKQISSLQISKQGHALVACDGHLYAVGGFGGDEVLTSVEQLSSLSSVWKDVGNLLTPRMRLSAVNWGGVIYAIGGKTANDDSTGLKSVERFDPNANKWFYVSEMNIERSSHACCVLLNKIFVIGGLNSKGDVVKEIESYDPITDKWTIVGTTKEELFNHTLVVV